MVKHGQQDGVLVLKVLVDKRTFDQRAHHLKQLVESKDDQLEENKKDDMEGEYEGRERRGELGKGKRGG